MTVKEKTTALVLMGWTMLNTAGTTEEQWDTFFVSIPRFENICGDELMKNRIIMVSPYREHLFNEKFFSIGNAYAYEFEHLEYRNSPTVL